MLQKAFPKLKYVEVKNANHFVQQDDPVAVNKLLRDFLQEGTKND